MKKFIKNNFYYILILVFVTVNFNTLEKVYILFSNDYDKRLISVYGYCEKEGYGFIKNNINKKIIASNFYIENKEDYPSIKGIFFRLNNKISNYEYIFLINQKQIPFKEENFKNYQILKNEGNCYLLKKND